MAPALERGRFMHLQWLLPSFIFAIFKTTLAGPIRRSYTLVAVGSPVNQGPMLESSDLWATAIANVAPLMALIGERNAKEYLRASSSIDQLLLMATAPLGIISIMIGAIRLSGPRILRRLVGRDNDRRSEALVELTPLSVAPATSVFTSHAVEIEPSEQRDRIAFVCVHRKETTNIQAVLHAFTTLLRPEDERAEPDRDSELVLGITKSTLGLEQTARLIGHLFDGDSTIDTALVSGVKAASLSFRMTGISPTQTVNDRTTSIISPSILNILISTSFFVLMCGVQIAGYLSGNTRKAGSAATLVMGLTGYCGIAASTFILLLSIKQEVLVKQYHFPPLFEGATWTISDSRHAEHKACDEPPGLGLVQATPRSFDTSQKRRRQLMTFLVSLGLAISYIVFYLGVRSAEWWVALGSLFVMWLSAVIRATTVKAFLVVNGKDDEVGEHWLGIFRDNLYDSLVATVATMDHKSTALKTPPQKTSDDRDSADIEFDSLSPAECATLIVAKPIRQSLRNWSGCEDVMKVSLEMAKKVCRTRTLKIPSHALSVKDMPSLRRVVRFHLMIYVPGLVWKADTGLDYIVNDDIDLPNLYRDILKIIHLSAKVKGTITRHEVSPSEAAELSHVLCGPVNVPKCDNPRSLTLTHLLCSLRAGNKPPEKHYTLEQAILLPTIQLATMYETFRDQYKSVIATYQDSYTDNLALSGSDFLGTLEEVFENQGIWSEFMEAKTTPGDDRTVSMRDETSGLYGRPVGGQRQGRTETEWLQNAARQCAVSHMSW